METESNRWERRGGKKERVEEREGVGVPLSSVRTVRARRNACEALKRAERRRGERKEQA